MMSWDRTYKIKESLAAIADAEFQEQAWTAAGGPVVSSPTEDLCQLFDDTGLGDDLEKGNTVFSDELDEQLRELDKLFGSLTETEATISDILVSAELATVRELAGNILFGIVRKEALDHNEAMAKGVPDAEAG